MTRPALLAVDGGASKIDVALVDRHGRVITAVRQQSSDHTGPHSEDYLDRVAEAVAGAVGSSGLDADRRPVAGLGVYCLSGDDFPADDRRLARWLGKQRWTEGNLVRNDTFAILRAGTDRGWGVAVVCGTGTNCSGVAPGGRTFRFPAIGTVSGDWGGGEEIGGLALWHAVRAEDGRGPKTSLARRVPAHFGLSRSRQVTEAIHFGRLSADRLVGLPPLVFEAAEDGDAVARAIVERQADEVVAMAGAAIRKLRLAKLDVDVVLGGGIFRNQFVPFFERIEEGLCRIAPHVQVSGLTAPPVAGAVLLGLDRLGASDAAKARARSALTQERFSAETQERTREE